MSDNLRTSGPSKLTINPKTEMRPSKGLLRRLAGICASSFLCRKGRRLWEANSAHWNYGLSKLEKLWCGGYIILSDYAEGIFPPRFEDQTKAYENEINYDASLPGVTLQEAQRSLSTKPFWNARACSKYLAEFCRIYSLLEDRGIKPGQRLLELGCGGGWMAEYFAIAGYSVVGTTISHYDVAVGNKKVEAMRCKGLSPDLKFLAWPMESIDQIPGARGAFDAVYVYQALHHAYDWRKTLRATAATLTPGGRLLLASEPNRLHKFISYRVARLSRTHEIGFSRSELVQALRASEFGSIEILQPKFDNWVTYHWITARKL